MLDQNDLKQIESLLEKVLTPRLQKTEEKLIIAMGEVLEQQVLPQFVALPNKNYLDDKLADLKGDLVVKVRRENEKVDFIVSLLRERGIFSDDDVRRIQQEFQIFPASSLSL